MAASQAIKQIEQLASGYNYGKWKNWYRGERIFNHEETAKRTHELHVLPQSKIGQAR